MINDVIRRLQKASVRPNDFSSRYSELLDRLWQRKDSESQAQSRAKTPNAMSTNPSSGPPSATNPIRNGIVNENNPSGPPGSRGQDPNATANSNFLAPSTPYNNRAPSATGWQTGMQDEFSWLDLQAVGELVSGGGDLTGAGWGAGNGMDGGGFGYYGNGYGPGEWGEFGGMEGGDDVGRFF